MIITLPPDSIICYRSTTHVYSQYFLNLTLFVLISIFNFLPMIFSTKITQVRTTAILFTKNVSLPNNVTKKVEDINQLEGFVLLSLRHNNHYQDSSQIFSKLLLLWSFFLCMCIGPIMRLVVPALKYIYENAFFKTFFKDKD